MLIKEILGGFIMAIDLLKVAFSILRELSEGNIPRAEDYGVTLNQFGNIITDLQAGKDYIKGASLSRGGQGNEVLLVFLNNARVTLDGLEYLHENSALMKTYKGLKEVKSWIPFI
jgi:hypothetical protein